MADKTINDYTAANSIDASNDYYLIEQSGVYKKINRNVGLGLASTPLGLTDIQSPQNKVFDNTNSITVKDGSLTIQNSSSTTKQAIFSASSITAGQTRTFTFPDLSGTLVTASGSQTLTNKTLTSPTITGGSIDNSTITVDSISGHTSGTLVTVANLQISNGVLNSNNSVVTANITDGAVTPAKLVSGAGAGWGWQTFTPSWTNLTVGNGAQTARYTQIGKMVWVFIFFTLGSTSAVGTNPSFTVPVPASSTYGSGGVNDNTIVGFGLTKAGNVGIAAPFFNNTNSAITVGYYTTTSAGSNPLSGITASLPGAWSTSNSFHFNAFYEAA